MRLAEQAFRDDEYINSWNLPAETIAKLGLEISGLITGESFMYMVRTFWVDKANNVLLIEGDRYGRPDDANLFTLVAGKHAAKVSKEFLMDCPKGLFDKVVQEVIMQSYKQ